MDRLKTRSYIKQEAEDSKESLKRALYSPVKIEPSCLERRIKRRHRNICNINFLHEKSYLDHELHVHTTKEKPIVDLKTLCCNICNKSYGCLKGYRLHMAESNNVRIPFYRLSKLDPSKTPDAEDPNNYCMSCDHTYKTPDLYRKHLIRHHRMPYLRPTQKKTRKPKDMKPKIDMLKMNCNACDIVFKSKKTYVQHLVKIHEITLPDIYLEPSNFDLKNRYCKVCDKTYSRNPAFIDYVRNMHHYTVLPSISNLIPNANDQDNYCIACDRGFCGKSTYLKHLMSMHIEQMPELYQGIDCKNARKEIEKLARYCAECKKIFLSKPLYRIHLDKTHGVKPIEPLRTLPSTDEPDMNHPKNYCTSCKRTYPSTNSFRQHLRYKHGLITSPKVPIRDKKSNVTPRIDLDKKYCNVCDRVYRTLDSYKIHMLKYHDMKLPVTDSRSKTVNRKEIPVIDQINRRCTACNKTYKSRLTFPTHLYRVHGILLPKQKKRLRTNHDIIPDIDDKNNHCASCDKAYSTSHGYHCHLARVHDMRRRKTAIKEECI